MDFIILHTLLIGLFFVLWTSAVAPLSLSFSGVSIFSEKKYIPFLLRPVYLLNNMFMLLCTKPWPFPGLLRVIFTPHKNVTQILIIQELITSPFFFIYIPTSKILKNFQACLSQGRSSLPPYVSSYINFHVLVLSHFIVCPPYSVFSLCLAVGIELPCILFVDVLVFFGGSSGFCTNYCSSSVFGGSILGGSMI